MNTGLLRPAVATVLTVHGIETFILILLIIMIIKLQQSLPFTVLKPTAITGIVIDGTNALQQSLPFTVLKPIRA